MRIFPSGTLVFFAAACFASCADDAGARNKGQAASSHYVLRVDVRDALPQDPPNVLETPEYATARAGVRRVAVLPPEFCRSQPAGKFTGESSAQETLLQARCGPLIAEFERSLAANHLNTYSSVDLASAVAKGDVTAVDAARKAGVDLVFVVNNLELVTAPQSVHLTRSFQQPDLKTNTWVAASLDAKREREFARTLRGTEQLMQRATRQRLGAALDVTAVLAATGEAIWFFKWTRYLPVKYARKILVECPPGGGRCSPVDEAAAPPGSYQGTFKIDSPFDEEATLNARFYVLTQQAISEMVSWFLRPLPAAVP
jgi:hypothetical protein